MTTETGLKRAGNMASLIYDQIRADILSGKLEPGAPLSQLALAKAAGTSRGPVREALRRLQQDRLVIARANQRFSVAPYDLADLESVLSLHLVNITLGIRVAVPLLKDEEIAALTKSAVALVTAADLPDPHIWEAAYRNFILSMVRHAGTRVVMLVEELIDNIQRYRETTLSHAPAVYVGGDQFMELVEAVKARDGARASAIYAKFAGRISSLILAGFAPHYEPARLRAYIVALQAYEER
ncbi:MAG: GntR family transcriptional regulator [Sphingobium sp.]